MTERIKTLRRFWVDEKRQKKFRQQPLDVHVLAERFAEEMVPDEVRAAERLRFMLRQEKPVVLPEERIVLLRTVPVLPELFTQEEWEQLRNRYYIHERGSVCNVTPDYSKLLRTGLRKTEQSLRRRVRQTDLSSEQRQFAEAAADVVSELRAFALRYRDCAEACQNRTAADSMEWISAEPPRSFLEALQLLRLIHFALWCSGNYHNTFGRFDQYMMPYAQTDLNACADREDLLELLEEFFINCNKDSDLYPGMQQGDNGQSIVLGGRNAAGEDCCNLLTELCLTACGELKLIDPKLNLRVHSGTPFSLYVKGTQLTRLGLGFPQYSNDDVIVPALLRWGYRPEDAWNYSIAACWEVIIPGAGMDIPNLNALSFPETVSSCIPALADCSDFESFLEVVHGRLTQRAEQMVRKIGKIYAEPAPLLSLMMDGCVETLQDISQGGVYNNYGFHGAGLATAADSLAAIRRYVYREKVLTPQKLQIMLDNDFAGEDAWLHRLRYETEKFGFDDEGVDTLATQLLDWYADALEGKTNSRGGICRAGTGSAMYYLWDGSTLGATPDGRRRGEALPCNYSPSLFVRVPGPISLIKSFTKPHLVRAANGGPLTLELHDSLFREEGSVRKVAAFVQSFFRLGGHQLQLNAVNREQLLDAKAHPEAHRNLIVRVWGWSGYFVELDEAYQDHILKRMEL